MRADALGLTMGFLVLRGYHGCPYYEMLRDENSMVHCTYREDYQLLLITFITCVRCGYSNVSHGLIHFIYPPVVYSNLSEQYPAMDIFCTHQRSLTFHGEQIFGVD